MSEQKLVNPYKGVDPNKMTTTSITVADKDRAFLLALYPEPSTLQITLNVLLVKLVAALTEKGLTSYNPEGYVEALNSLKLVWNGVEPHEVHKKARKEAMAS